jgi:2'-5' RNA ligase
MTRLFVAVTPPAEAVEAVREAINRGRAAAPGLRWVDPERIHLTLVFLGSVGDDLRGPLLERLGQVAHRHPPVSVALGPTGRFGDRVLWVGVTGDLEPLAAGVRRAAERAGVDGLESRPLRAHLTLARARESRAPAGGGAADLRPVLESIGELPAVPWTVFGFELMSSILGHRPRYTVEAAWPLTGHG